MTSNVTGFIKDLKKSYLNATCPNCRNEFSLAKALLFDGTKQFPQTAELTRLEWEQRLVDRISELKVKKNKTAARSQTGAIASGVGKILEKILPAHKNFDMESADWASGLAFTGHEPPLQPHRGPPNHLPALWR